MFIFVFNGFFSKFCFFQYFFQNSKSESPLKLQIHAGFDNMWFISMKNWSFNVFCGSRIKEDLRLQTSFFVARKNGIFLYVLLTKNLRIFCQVIPQIFLVALFFFAKLPNNRPPFQHCVVLPFTLKVSISFAFVVYSAYFLYFASFSPKAFFSSLF